MCVCVCVCVCVCPCTCVSVHIQLHVNYNNHPHVYQHLSWASERDERGPGAGLQTGGSHRPNLARSPPLGCLRCCCCGFDWQETCRCGGSEPGCCCCHGRQGPASSPLISTSETHRALHVRLWCADQLFYFYFLIIIIIIIITTILISNVHSQGGEPDGCSGEPAPRLPHLVLGVRGRGTWMKQQELRGLLLQWSRLSHGSKLVCKPTTSRFMAFCRSLCSVGSSTSLSWIIFCSLIPLFVLFFLSVPLLFEVQRRRKKKKKKKCGGEITTTARPKLWTRRWQKARSSIWVCRKPCSSASWCRTW